MIKSLLILGAGTSGLVSALILKSRFNYLDIKIVKSNDIGIIGVGEGSTEHWTTFMKACGISVSELVKETDATFKTGIKFVNWNGDGDYYFHSLHSSYVHESPTGFPFVYAHLIAEKESHHDLIPKNIHESKHAEHFETSVNQFHFNTFKLNQYLLKLCSERNIDIVDDTIQDVMLDDQGYVQTLIGNNNKYSADFFIDCSGFRRVISSKLGAKWIDCSEYLPMNAAIAFPTERLEEIPSNTASTAMSSGWMWRIPTQGRFGNGYVYSDNFLTEDQAIAEAQSVFSEKIEIAKKIKFTAGYVDKFWLKNCVALGLAGSFVEPLEASSIGTSIQQSLGLASQLMFWTKGDESCSKIYNAEFETVAKNIIDFVQLHYFTKRNDTEFWRWCKEIKKTDFNAETFDSFRINLPNHHYFAKPFIMFRDQNWLQIMHGLGMLDKLSIKKIMDSQNDDIKFAAQDAVKNFAEWERSAEFVSHRKALEILMNRAPFQKIEFNV